MYILHHRYLFLDEMLFTVGQQKVSLRVINFSGNYHVYSFDENLTTQI